MKKRYGCLLLAALLLAGSALTVRADDYKGKDGWRAEFTGDAIKSNFTSQTFADEAASLLPGDSVEIRIAVRNSSGKGSDWYMSNETVKSLEDSSTAKGGSYSYELSYRGNGKTTTLYSSSNVGADDGLHDATDGLDRFVYLDHLSKGKQGYITLKVALDGETQGNSYQNTLARLQLNFAVEGTNEGGSGGRRGGGSGGGGLEEAAPGSVVYSPGAVQTGDSQSVALWSTAALASGLVLLFLAVFGRRKERRQRT